MEEEKKKEGKRIINIDLLQEVLLKINEILMDYHVSTREAKFILEEMLNTIKTAEGLMTKDSILEEIKKSKPTSYVG